MIDFDPSAILGSLEAAPKTPPPPRKRKRDGDHAFEEPATAHKKRKAQPTLASPKGRGVAAPPFTPPMSPSRATIKSAHLASHGHSTATTSLSAHGNNEKEARPVSLWPSRRWRSQKLLQNCVGIPEERAIEDNDERVIYCRALEQAIYVYAVSDVKRYELKIKQLASNLLQNGAWLMATYDATKVSALNDALLAEGTVQEKRRKEFEDRVATCRLMMSNINKIFNEENEPAAMLVCKNCKGTNIDIKLLQTRSADEGMTTFCECQNPKCKKRWRFGG